MMKYLVVVLSCLIVSLSAETTGAAAFTTMPSSVRMLGISGAGTALNDTSAVYSNPSVLSYVRHSEVNVFHASLLGGVNYLSFSANTNQEYLGCTYAVQMVNATLSGFQESYYDSGTIGLTGKRFDYNAYTYVGSVAKRLSDTLSVGVNLKYSIEDLYDKRATGYGADLGLTYLANQYLQYAATVRNSIPTKMTWNTDAQTVESAARQCVFGVAYFGIKDWALLADAYTQEDKTLGLSTGLEYYMNNYFAFRAGTDLKNITLGSSLYVDRFALHFAFKPDFEGVAGNAYYLSGAYFFDTNLPAPIVAVPEVAPVVVNLVPDIPTTDIVISPSVIVTPQVEKKADTKTEDPYATVYVYADDHAENTNVWVKQK